MIASQKLFQTLFHSHIFKHRKNFTVFYDDIEDKSNLIKYCVRVVAYKTQTQIGDIKIKL